MLASNFAVNPERMEVKMRFMAESLAEGMISTLQWRVILGVMGLRPPPGGAAHTNISVSTMSFQKSFSRS